MAVSNEQPGSVTKSITRLLQHSILQLCNEHIGYSHKLQILGVLCMTVDDEQQELVVKVNNTLKRVNPPAPSKPDCNPVTPLGSHLQASLTAPSTMSFPSMTLANSDFTVSTSVTPSRRSHGRKGNHPTKVLHQVYDDGGLRSEDEEDIAGAITVIPEAPEATALQTGAMSAQHSPPTAASAPATIPQQFVGATNGSDHTRITGSAKRKTSHQYRVPQHSSSCPSPADSTNGLFISADDVPSDSEDVSNGTSGDEPASSSQSIPQLLNVPIFVAGSFGNKQADGTQMNGLLDDQPSNGLDLSVTHSKMGKSRKRSPKIKREPKDDLSAFDYSNHVLDLSTEDARSHSLNSLMSVFNPSTSDLLKMKGTDLLSSHYGSLGLLAMAGHSNTVPSPSSNDSDGLFIKYTPTGPYTVGANGQDVSNSSRIKDIIVFDDQSPLGSQKGTRLDSAAARMEADFIVDKLGMDGRKRRRRAPEDQLTPEEIAEYLGHDKDMYSFKCKYCSEEFDNVTRYIHHSLQAHQAYICHQCGKSFTTKSSLLRHRPIHTGMRRFACSICKKTFYRKDKCKAHIKRHLGITENGEAQNRSSEEHIEAAPLALSAADSPASSTDLNLLQQQSAVDLNLLPLQAPAVPSV